MPFSTTIGSNCPICGRDRYVESVSQTGRTWDCLPDVGPFVQRRHLEEELSMPREQIERAPEIPPESPAKPINYGGNYVY